MPSAEEWSGIAQGASQFGKWLGEKPERDARRQEAEARAQISQIKLDEYKAAAPVRQAQREDELATLRAQTYQINANLAKAQSYDAFTKYQADGDVRHLNNWLAASKNNPVASNITRGMVRLDAIQQTPETEKMLREVGIKDTKGLFEDPELSNSYVIGTTPDGKQTLVDMNRMFAGTGYTQFATDRDIAAINSKSAILQQLRAGANMANIKADSEIVGQVSEATGIPREEVFQMLREQPSANRTGSSAIERVAANLRSENPDLLYRDSLSQAVDLMTKDKPQAGTNEERFIQDYVNRNPSATREEALAAYRQTGREQRTTAQQNIEYTEEAKKGLDKMFGGNFLDADLSTLDSKQQAEMANYVNRIEKVGGLELSADEKKQGRNIRRLLSLGKVTGEQLTPEQTGLLDSTLNYMKTYISDNVEGKDATIAYENFRAVARNALFGSQVSNADYKAFNKAFATLGQQTGPVLESLKVQLSMIRDDLQSMADLNDPYVTKARFGMTLEEADRTIDAIGERISILNRIAQGKPVGNIKLPSAQTEGIKVETTEDKVKPSLEEIFG